MHNKADSENLSSIFLQVYSLLSVPMRKLFYFLLVAILLLAFVESTVLGLIAFYAASVSDPQASIQIPAVISLQNIAFIKPFILNPTTMIASLSVLVMLALPLKNAFRGWVTYRIARQGLRLAC